MHPPTYLRTTLLGALASSVCWLTACGGRFQTIQEVEDDDGPPVAGASTGGAPSAGGKAGSSGRGGAPRGGSSSGGAAASGGASCAEIGCPAIACGPSQMPVMTPGNCCITCVDDPGACMKGQALYQQERALYAEKASYGCASSAECGIVTTTTRCELCGYAAVWYGTAEYFQSSAAFAAEQYCGACAPAPVFPCDPPPGNAACVQGRCMMPFLL